MNVTIVDYGIGNLLSVKRALLHNGANVRFASTPIEVEQAERLVVPGVGAFSHCMQSIENLGLKQPLIDYAESGRPFLGICVGMQMLLESSNEFGDHKGLGLIPGSVEKISVEGHRTPFIGWKRVELLGSTKHFYFVHSYEALPQKHSDLLATYTLGEHKVTAAVRNHNVLGVQFHPEKSARDGLAFIDYFLTI